MTQTLRPDSNVTQTNVVGGYADIDESSASDLDYVASNSNVIGTLVVGLSNPSGTPNSGTSTIRYRAAKVGTGSLTVTVALLEGTTVIDTAVAQALTTTYTNYTWNPDTSAVSNWSNLRFRARFSADASATGRLSWAEMEIPAPAYSISLTSASFSANLQAVTLRAPKTLSLASASFAVTASAITFRYNRVFPIASGSYSLSLTDPTLHRGYSMSITSGQYLVTMNAGTPIAIDSAAYVATFADIGFRYNRVFSFASGSFTVTGNNITLAKGYFLDIGSIDLACTMDGITFAVREPNGWNVPKYPELNWSQGAAAQEGGWQEVVAPQEDWSEAA
jgi:hypothetical protein